MADTWPQDHSDLKADSKAIWGKLENGLRYVIYPNQYPVPGRASLRLYVDAGSLMEEEDQQGMAHFLEHMAFNGSKNLPAGTMVERFQRMGMAFGADTNAHTSFKETVYKLEVPKTDETMMSEALELFRDDLDGLLLGEKEIEKERGIILSEKLARDSVDSRTMEEGYKFAFPKSIIPFRMPIGLEETIKTMPRQRFVDFYEKWYTPKRAVVAIVGDVDVKQTEALIKKYFESAKAARGDHEDPKLGAIEAGSGVIAKLHTEMEAAATELSIEAVKSTSDEGDTQTTRREKLVRNLADAMINQRLSVLIKSENSPVMEAQAYNYEMFKFAETSGIYAKCHPDKWKEALALVEQELRRALDFGFTDAEFDEATASLLRTVKLRAEQKDTRKNVDLANSLVRTLSNDQVFTDPVDDLARVTEDLKTLNKEECLKSLQKGWERKSTRVFVGGNLKLENAESQIVSAFEASQNVKVEAPAAQGKLEFAYTNFGVTGKVVDSKVVEDLAIHQAKFENEVHVNVKKTDFEKNSVRVMVSFGGGKLQAPADKPGLTMLAQSTFVLGALEKHSSDDLRRIFASKTLGSERGNDVADFSIADDNFVLGGKTTPADLEAQLQVLAAYLTAPGYRVEAERQFKKNLDPLYTELLHTAEGVMQNQVVAFTHNNDFRFGFPDKAVLEKRNLDEVKTWLNPILQSSYLEVAIVGDIDPQVAIDLVAKTFGALPKRDATKPAFEAERKMAFPAEPKDKDFNFTTEIPRSYALAYWPTDDMSDVKRTRRLVLLGSILDDRLRIKIREELGETYSPASYHVASEAFKGYGYMTAMASLKPEQVKAVKGMFLEIAEDLIKNGISEDEFQRAKEPQIQQIIQTRRDNRYWLSRVLATAALQPYRFDWARTIEDDFRNIQRQEVEALAKTYLKPDRAYTIGIIPHQE